MTGKSYLNPLARNSPCRNSSPIAALPAPTYNIADDFPLASRNSKCERNGCPYMGLRSSFGRFWPKIPEIGGQQERLWVLESHIWKCGAP